MHTHPFPQAHHDPATTRRDFLSGLLGVWAGASLVELSTARACLARAQAAGAKAKLFDIQQVRDGVYLAVARPATMLNCNAAIFEGPTSLVVVDTHSKPSAAASLIAQLKKEVSAKPVRYVVNTHFHWDHAQGASAYRRSFSELDIISSEPTKKLIGSETEKRLAIQLEEEVPRLIEEAREKLADATGAKERAFYENQIRQLNAYAEEMKNFSVELPTITFDRSYVLRDEDEELQLSFHGRAHTAGDVTVYSPRTELIATGDLVHGFFPYIGDGFPRDWPATLEAMAKSEFQQILPGHGPLQTDRRRLQNFRAYLEELTERVASEKEAGKGLAETQESIAAGSVRSLQSDDYGEFLIANNMKYRAMFGDPPPLQQYVNLNIEHIYRNLDRD